MNCSQPASQPATGDIRDYAQHLLCYDTTGTSPLPSKYPRHAKDAKSVCSSKNKCPVASPRPSQPRYRNQNNVSCDVKVSLRIIKKQAITMYGGIQERLHGLLTSVVHGRDCSAASRPGRFICEKRVPLPIRPEVLKLCRKEKYIFLAMLSRFLLKLYVCL
jgi:hypothetical protein